MDKKNIYVKQIEKIGKHTVWLVDGEYIRKNIDENFVEYDEHYHLSFIPKDEFWIDQITNPEERYFFIDHMINEQWEIEKHKTYEEAMKKADEIEKKEREKIESIEDTGKKAENQKEIIEKIHKHPIMAYSNTGDLKLWIVDGRLVRDHFLIQYADGGHDRVYSFIPKNEIWIEDCVPENERDFILLHELHERFLMGEGKDYRHAHMGATEVEDYYRDHPDETTKRIEEEIQKNISGKNNLKK